ncbi:MAG: hypothetical protein ACRDD8_13695 [Bacteroidales bacterium]
MGINDIQNKAIEWNVKFPLDKWYRDKYRIPFMSKQHRESSFCNIRFEWEEEKVFNSLESITEEYIPDSGNFFKKGTEKVKTEEELKNEGDDFFKKFLEDHGE